MHEREERLLEQFRELSDWGQKKVMLYLSDVLEKYNKGSEKMYKYYISYSVDNYEDDGEEYEIVSYSVPIIFDTLEEAEAWVDENEAEFLEDKLFGEKDRYDSFIHMANEQEIELTDNDIKCDDFDIVVFSSMC